MEKDMINLDAEAWLLEEDLLATFNVDQNAASRTDSSRDV